MGKKNTKQNDLHFESSPHCIFLLHSFAIIVLLVHPYFLLAVFSFQMREFRGVTTTTTKSKHQGKPNIKENDSLKACMSILDKILEEMDG